jgi:GT2 family glycosyltransferase
MENLVGIVTYGNLEFTKMAVRSVWETVDSPVDFFVVVGKPEDKETPAWLRENGISYIKHGANYGFPFSVNDLYDYAWKENDYRNLIIMGNDVVAYPYAIDSMIHVADTTDNAWVCAREYSVKSLCKEYPEAGEYFNIGSNYKFTQFDERPWEMAIADSEWISPNVETNGAGMSDVHNLALFKREIFDEVGYIDVNFYPAYYEDNDYVRRAINAGVTKSCRVLNAIYFHFWSRTIHQGSGGSNTSYFHENRTFYMRKWGGDFGYEAFEEPFNGQPYYLGDVVLQPEFGIHSREDEFDIIDFWMNKHRGTPRV